MHWLAWAGVTPQLRGYRSRRKDKPEKEPGD
jgi:hypothetical protein